MTDTDKSTSQALVLTGSGGYDAFKLQPIPQMDAGKGELKIEVKAAGMNFADMMVAAGYYPDVPVEPGVLGYEGAGVVHSLGEDVKDFEVGDRVICQVDFSKCQGTWQEFVVAPANQCHLMPKEMTFEEGAAIPINYVTAYHMLFEFGNLRPNRSVLIHSAGGGVGVAATQLCRTVPNVTIFGTASAAKHEAIRQNGVDHPIDYCTQDYVTEIRKVSPEGVDIGLDPLGGADSDKVYKLLKPLGRIIHYGYSNTISGPSKSLRDITETVSKTLQYKSSDMIPLSKAACGYSMSCLGFSHPANIETMKHLLQMYTQGSIKPIIDSVWKFQEVHKAMARFHERKNIGKVILTP